MPQLSKNHWIIGGIIGVILLALGVGLGIHFSTTEPGPLKCLMCTGMWCENGDTGTSTTCPPATAVCMISTMGSKIQRECGPVKGSMGPLKPNDCVTLPFRGDEKVVCTCDTEDDCNLDQPNP